ncbi:MAG: phosphoadenosine phosphosulfate reductase family protein [Methanotrichaceae archaeon]|nr:phosphoadenosine phosphosulfate reductase family protein [Methanotrichaceae archaeon]
MDQHSRTFSPGKKDLFWCPACNLPLLSPKCSQCGGSGQRLQLSPPADVRLCSPAGRERLIELFRKHYGWSGFLDRRIILLNKIAGLDRRDQVILDGRNIATIWFDPAASTYRLDLELDGALLLADHAEKKVLSCSPELRGHLKGKWIDGSQLETPLTGLEEGDCVILRMGRLTGVGVVRWRNGSPAVRVKDLSREKLRLSSRLPSLSGVIRANQAHLKKIERIALRELDDFLSRNRLPVNVSFSGGKDSLAALILARKVRPECELIFINTGLEFPETVDYVRRLSAAEGLKLHEISGENRFFSQAGRFGPPAKDYRWCCKTNKLGPLTDFIADHYPKGCVTVEGRRIYESFNRARIGFIERNPYVPGQLTLSPIRNWNALEVMLYIHWNGYTPNPLYDQDYERIGCWLCPASLQSEFENTKETHPELYQRWNAFLLQWAKEQGLDRRFVELGFWRWKSHPPKIRELAESAGILLRPAAAAKDEARLEVVWGRSPCGLEHSIEARLSLPEARPFAAVANALNMVGEVKFSEELGTALVKTEKGRVTVSAGGHIMVVAPEREAEELLRQTVKTIARVQMCNACGICEKSCPRGAIKVRDTITVDPRRCTRCGRCERGCIVVDMARKMF